VWGHSFFGAAFYGPRYFGPGAGAAEAETPSGGWRRRDLRPGLRQREQTDEEIKAERIRMGILPPDPPPYIENDTTGDITPEGVLPPLPLAAYLLPEDLAGLEALVARAAELTIDGEIALWLRLAEQRRLHAEWLRDEDDAAVLLLAIATVH
jgi:hypothetical protein